jgi:hypothetical protein
MSGASAMREIGTGDKSVSSWRTHSRESTHKHKEESSSSIKSQRKGDKKKKMKKVVYYETDSSSPSTFGSESASTTSKRHERKKYSKMPLRYPRISKRTPLLSVPLGKPPMFDGEDYSMWSDNGILLSIERRYQRRGTRITIRRRSNKSNTSTPKPLLYSSPL